MVEDTALPELDLVVATVDRVDQLDRLFDSLERQSYRGFRVLLVDQNEDDRLGPVIERHAGLDLDRLRSPRGLSRARNAALGSVTADLVAFPDDDCVYADDLLERVARRFAERPDLDGLTGRAVSLGGHRGTELEDGLRGARSRQPLEPGDLVHGVPATRRSSSASAPSTSISASGRELPGTRARRSTTSSARCRTARGSSTTPSLTVAHEAAQPSPDALRALGHRDGASVGYILRKHRYPARVLARMLVRPVGGAARLGDPPRPGGGEVPDSDTARPARRLPRRG